MLTRPKNLLTTLEVFSTVAPDSTSRSISSVGAETGPDIDLESRLMAVDGDLGPS